MTTEQNTLAARCGAHRTVQPWTIRVPIIVVCFVASAAAQTTLDGYAPAAPVRVQDEPPAQILVDPPLAEPLSLGTAVVRYRTENLRVAPLFGPGSLSLYPRVGHLHVSVDDAPWVWAHASGAPVTVAGLEPGPHRVRVQLMNANHQQLDESSIKFAVPDDRIPASTGIHIARQLDPTAVRPVVSDPPPARIIIDPPAAEPLSRGVVFVRYRAENLDIVPVSPSTALATSRRIGHIHVRVDETPWHWADLSGNPVIIQRLAPGRHNILIQLVNSNEEVLDHGTVEVTVEGPKSQPGAH